MVTAPEYGFDGRNRLQLEKKDDMKGRGQPSPDVGDALALTFAMPVSRWARNVHWDRKFEEHNRA